MTNSHAFNCHSSGKSTFLIVILVIHLSPCVLLSSFFSQWIDLSSEFWTAYKKTTPKKIQLIDMFLVFAVTCGVLQALYTLVSGMYPYNSFLASFINCVGFFIFTVCLRLQIMNPKDFGNISGEQSLAAYVFCNLLLFFVVLTYLG